MNWYEKIAVGIVAAAVVAGFLFFSGAVKAADTSNADYSSSTVLWVHSFENDTANTEPTDLTKVGTNNSYKATTTRAWNGTQSIGLVGLGSITHNFGFFDQETVTTGDYEVSALMYFEDYAGDRAGIVGRANGTEGYACALRNGNTLRLAYYSGASETVISTVSTSTLATDTWYRIKMVFDGTSIKCKFWDADVVEPTTWFIDTTDATIDNTNYGIGMYGYIGNTNRIYFDELTAYDYPDLPYTNPANDDQEILNAWFSWKQDFLRSDGAVVRPDDVDIVSEGLAYGLMLAVQNNDKVTFDRIEAFASTTMERRNDGESVDPHLMGYRYDASAIGNDFIDNNWASDADNDRAVALLWAYYRWGDAKYLTSADIVIDALKRTFNTEGSRTLQVPYVSEITDTDPEINPSYMRPAAFALFKQHDTASSSFWQTVIDDSYYMLESHTDNAGSLPTTAGIPADWMSWDTNGTDEAAAPGGGGHTTTYGFEAIRVMWAVEIDRQFYNTASSTAYFTDQVGDFFDDQYFASSTIAATYDHDGTNPSGYDLSYPYWMAYFAVAQASTTGAATIYTAELDDLYATSSTPTGVRAYIGSDGYYGGSWNLLSKMLYNGDFVNYGADVDTSDHPTRASIINMGNIIIY